MRPDSMRLPFALLLSLLIHALLLSLNLGGQGLGLPAFGLPWQERRIAVPEIRVVLVPPRTMPPDRRLGLSQSRCSGHG